MFLLHSKVLRRHLTAASWLTASLPVFLLPVRAAAQKPAPPHTTHTPAITVNARLVVLDVVVTDAHGKAAENLTRDDFKIFEDGKLQRIRTFDPPSSHALPNTALASAANTVFDPSQPASLGQSPVTILVLDQLNTHFADSSFARRELRSYLLKQPALLAQPTTLLTVYENRFKMLQQFTRNRDTLLKALGGTHTEYAWELENSGKANYGPLLRLDQSLRALEQIAQSYAPIRGRKNLVWIGGGFPTLNPDTLAPVDAREIQDTLQHITDTLLDTRVTLYAVDPSSSAAGMSEITNEFQQSFVLAAGDALAENADPFGASDDFNRLGPVTGGRIVRGMNDVAAQIASAVDLGADYYTLGYAPTSTADTPGQYRNIKVVCVRPGFTATTRSGYYTPRSREENSAATAAYDLTTAAESAVPLNALHITAEADPVSALQNDWVVRVAAPGLTWRMQSDGNSIASVYVMAVSLDKHGKMVEHALRGMIATAKPTANLRDPAKMADFHFIAQPAPKATVLRFIVRDSATGHMGSFDLPLRKR